MKKLILMAAAACAFALSAGAYAVDGQAVAAQAEVQQAQQPAYGRSTLGTSIEAAKAAYAEAVKPGATAAERAESFWHMISALLFGTGGVALGMTTLAVNKSRAFEVGNRNEFGVIDNDIIYEGAAVGVVDATGYAQPLASSANRFAGFAERQADNTITGHAAGFVNVTVVESGKVQLSVTGAVITDVGQPVYASDDDTFSFSPVGGIFIGYVHRFVSSGVVVVKFDAPALRDPWGHKTMRETLTGTKTFDAEDCGKLFVVTSGSDGLALTLPAIAAGLSGLTIMAGGAFGSTAVTVDPNASDMILGPDITGADNKDLICTKATQRRGDFVTLIAGDADGYMVTELRGTWAREA